MTPFILIELASRHVIRNKLCVLLRSLNNRCVTASNDVRFSNPSYSLANIFKVFTRISHNDITRVNYSKLFRFVFRNVRNNFCGCSTKFGVNLAVVNCTYTGFGKIGFRHT